MLRQKNLLLMLYGAGTAVYFEVVGQLRLMEPIALLNIIFIDIRMLIRHYPSYKVVLQCLIVFLISQIISDIVNGSNPRDYLRGWATIIFAMLSTTAMLNNLHGNQRGIVVYTGALMVVNALFQDAPIDMELQREDTNYFKSRVVGFVNPAILLSAFYFRVNGIRKPIVVLFGGYALVCFAFDARSNGLIYLFSAALLYIKLARLRLSSVQVILVFLCFVLPISYLLYVFYVDEVIYHGFGGANSRRQLALAENPYNPFELLYYGRTDFFALIEAIKDSPLIGHGSWGRDPTGKYTDLRSASGTVDFDWSTGAYIKAHSVFLGAWAWSGFAGFCAVLYMYYRLFSLISRLFRYGDSSYLPIVIVMGVDMLWAFFFSPLGLLRTTFPFFVAVVITEYGRQANSGRVVMRSIQFLRNHSV